MEKNKSIEDNTRTIRTYKYWGIEWDYYPNSFLRGAWMLLVIITAPIWFWFWVFYIIISTIGELNGRPKVIEKKIKEEEKTYY